MWQTMTIYNGWSATRLGSLTLAESVLGIYSGSYDVEEIERAITDLIEKEYVVYIKRSNAFR